MELKATEDITLYSNNKISIVLTKNAKNQYQTKHINVQYHYIWKLVNKKDLIIKWILGSKMLADRITKFLLTEIFRRYQALLKMALE